jgi:hypothetical protein
MTSNAPLDGKSWLEFFGAPASDEEAEKRADQIIALHKKVLALVGPRPGADEAGFDEWRALYKKMHRQLRRDELSGK